MLTGPGTMKYYNFNQCIPVKLHLQCHDDDDDDDDLFCYNATMGVAWVRRQASLSLSLVFTFFFTRGA